MITLAMKILNWEIGALAALGMNRALPIWTVVTIITLVLNNLTTKIGALGMSAMQMKTVLDMVKRFLR